MTKRIFIMTLILSLSFGLVIGKITYVQLFQGEAYALKSLANRTSPLALEETPRGDILDCHGASLLNDHDRPALVILPHLASDPKRLLALVNDLLPQAEIKPQDILPGEAGEALVFPKPIIYPLEDEQMISIINSWQEPAAIVAPYKTRYSDQPLAVHLIGYLNYQNDGAKGLEKQYNQALKAQRPQTYLTPITDAYKRTLPGLGYRLIQDTASEERTNLWLTLDKDTQRLLEDTLNATYLTKGAAVIIDVATGNILAAASRPTFDPNDLTQNYGYSDNQLDRVMGIDYTYYPGSVFKLLTAMIALEEGVAEKSTTFLCDNLPPYNKCPRLHGSTDFSQALKVSCNNYFIHLGQDIGQKKLEYYLLDQLNFTLETGKKLDSFGARANGVIGQELFKVSPLQMANFMATIANDGRHLSLEDPVSNRLVLGTAPSGQSPALYAKTNNQEQVFQPKAAQDLQDMLQNSHTITKNGTTKTVTYAGKTGTPEVYTKDAQKHYLAWYTGYAPFDQPKYAIAIVVEEIAGVPSMDLSGGKYATPIFKSLIEQLP